MRLFDQLRGKAKAGGPKAAAEKLFAYSRIDLNAEILPDGAVRCRPSVNANFKFTKTAIILQWLQKMKKNPTGAACADAVLEEFERLTFGGLEPGTAPSLDEHLRKLMEITDAIDTFMSSRVITEEDPSRAGFKISEKWFEIALGEPKLVARATLMHGAEIIRIIYEQMNKIGAMVGSSVFAGETR